MTAAVATPTPGPSGLRLLLRLALSRDRAMVPIWYAVLLLVTFASASSTPTLYATEAERVRAATVGAISRSALPRWEATRGACPACGPSSMVPRPTQATPAP